MPTHSDSAEGSSRATEVSSAPAGGLEVPSWGLEVPCSPSVTFLFVSEAPALLGSISSFLLWDQTRTAHWGPEQADQEAKQ